MRIPYLAAAAALIACGGGSTGSVPAEMSSDQVVRAFMQAVADSDLVRMGDLWGSNRGPANVTRFPPEYPRRLAVIQAWLRGSDSIRVISDIAVQGSSNERKVVIAYHRAGCIKQIPITTVRSGRQWLISNIDIGMAGTPAKPCEPGS
jgi:hypothetical protein